MYRGLLARPVDDADPGVMREIILAVPPLDWFGDAPTSPVVGQRGILRGPFPSVSMPSPGSIISSVIHDTRSLSSPPALVEGLTGLRKMNMTTMTTFAIKISSVA